MLQGWPLKTLGSPKEVALYQAGRLQQFVDKSNGGLVLLRTRGDLANFLKQRQAGSHVVAAFLGTEGAQPLEGKIENLDALYAAGFRMMSPTHFTDTAIGGSAAGVAQGRTHSARPRVGEADGSARHAHRRGALPRPTLCAT